MKQPSWPGTGKTSHAIALMAAAVRCADTSELSKPYGCLFVVDQIKKADDMYRQINELLPGQVAVWTTAHDVNAINNCQATSTTLLITTIATVVAAVVATAVSSARVSMVVVNLL